MIKGKNSYSFIFIISLLSLLSACRNNIVFTDSITMPAKKWELMNIPSFNVPVDDTIKSNNVIFTIRTSSSYPFRNIFLFVKTTSPDGVSITDTLQYYLADEKGKWYGKGFGDIHELNLPYKSNVYFPVRGTYRFTVQHGMRVEDLNGVYDFGLRIEKTSK
jgi:gliding motility-associated lipoprotein GldH